MKYFNSLKYISLFPVSGGEREVSQGRSKRLCERLGRVNIGARYICVPGGSAGHALAVMLERVMVESGHTVGHIRLDGGRDVRTHVTVSGEKPSIDDFNAAVSALKSAVQKSPDEGYLFEEVSFILALLLCRMSGCEYIILEGIGGESALEAICAPYELIIIPSIYGEVDAYEHISVLGESIRRGTREVVSGNQKSEVYNMISNACAISGVRLDIPVKAQFEIAEVNARSLGFSYCGRDGFTMRSPSKLLRDVAMTVIESSLALRRGGVKLPWSSISSGIAAVTTTGCFEIFSVMPLVLMDTAASESEAELLMATADEVWGEGTLFGAALFIEGSSKATLRAFDNKSVGEIVVYGTEDGEERDGFKVIDTVKDTARRLITLYRKGNKAICLGSIDFLNELKEELLKLM